MLTWVTPKMLDALRALGAGDAVDPLVVAPLGQAQLSHRLDRDGMAAWAAWHVTGDDEPVIDVVVLWRSDGIGLDAAVLRTADRLPRWVAHWQASWDVDGVPGDAFQAARKRRGRQVDDTTATVRRRARLSTVADAYRSAQANGLPVVAAVVEAVEHVEGKRIKDQTAKNNIQAARAEGLLDKVERS